MFRDFGRIHVERMAPMHAVVVLRVADRRLDRLRRFSQQRCTSVSVLCLPQWITCTGATS
jgi:hypothetical protein